jgi:small nuclear ribonucleoprotein E
MASTKVQRIMTQPINLIFRFLQSVRIPYPPPDTPAPSTPSSPLLALLLTLILVEQKARIQIWLFEQKDMRIEGRIIVSTRALAVSGFIHFLLGFGPVLRRKRLPGSGSGEDFTVWGDEGGSLLFGEQS